MPNALVLAEFLVSRQSLGTRKSGKEYSFCTDAVICLP